jgi:hypothetical protein
MVNERQDSRGVLKHFPAKGKPESGGNRHVICMNKGE